MYNCTSISLQPEDEREHLFYTIYMLFNIIPFANALNSVENINKSDWTLNSENLKIS